MLENASKYKREDLPINPIPVYPEVETMKQWNNLVEDWEYIIWTFIPHENNILWQVRDTQPMIEEDSINRLWKRFVRICDGLMKRHRPYTQEEAAELQKRIDEQNLHAKGIPGGLPSFLNNDLKTGSE